MEAYGYQEGAENTREELTDGIVAAEWFMFDKVNNIGGRADCQDDLETFSIMRRSFFQRLWHRYAGALCP